MNQRSWELQNKKKESKSGQGVWGLAGSSLAILLTVAAASSAAKDAPREVETRFQITVRVYHYAGVASGTLLRAEEEGTRIFRKAGVEVVWLECSVSPSPEGQAIRTKEGNEADPSYSIFPIVRYDVKGNMHLLGTGFFITSTGLFVTARHVLKAPFDSEGVEQRSEEHTSELQSRQYLV